MVTLEVAIGSEDQRHSLTIVAVVPHRQQILFEPVEQLLVLLARRDDTVLLTTLEVDVQAVEPGGVGLGRTPIDVEKQRKLTLDRRVLQRHVALLEQPRVQVHAPVEGREPVVGHDDQGRVLVDVLQDPPDGLVHLLIEGPDPIAQGSPSCVNNGCASSR